MSETLTHLIAEARGLANDHPCAHGHDWKTDGGRGCPVDISHCSQPVFVCRRCGDYDYGEVDGPAWRDWCGPCDLRKSEMLARNSNE